MPSRELLDWGEISDLAGGGEVGVHLHAPMSREAGFPVYSVLRGNKAMGHTTGGAMLNPRININKFQFVQALNNPTKAKTRNTLIMGTPTTDTPSGEEQPLRIRLGKVSVGDKTVFEVPTEPGDVRLRKTVRGKSSLADPAPGLVIPRGFSPRSHVFASAVVFGRHGVSAIDPKEL